jgi:hypothetical protein
MRRIGRAVVLALGLVLVPFAGAAQQRASKVYRIGFLYGPPVTSGSAVFEQALSELGWVRTRDLTGHLGAIDFSSRFLIVEAQRAGKIYRIGGPQ